MMDKTIEFIVSQFIINIPALIALSVLLVLFLVQVYFYILYYNKPVSAYNNRETQNKKNYTPSVSVIIIAKNESEHLTKNLPSILSQDYPNFEVIVVNDGSTDETQHYLENLSKSDNKLYSTFLPTTEDQDSNKRHILCLTIGIKAAKNDVLLFTDTCAAPIGNNWISSMMNSLGSKEIVIGYTKFNTPNSLWGRVCRFDNLLFSLQYLSMAMKGKPFIGTYSNLAFTKELFFRNRGFSQTLNYKFPEEIYLNKILKNNETAIAMDKDSFTSIKIDSFDNWENIKRVYSISKKHFKGYLSTRFKLESITRYLIYLTTLVIAIYSILFQLWAYLVGSILLLIVRNLVQYLVLRKASKHFDLKTMFFCLPLMDLLQPIYNRKFKR